MSTRVSQIAVSKITNPFDREANLKTLRSLSIRKTVKALKLVSDSPLKVEIKS